MRSRDYGPDLSRPLSRAELPTVAADRGLVVEEAGSGWCGAVVECDKGHVSLEDRRGRVRVFPLAPGGFLLAGQPATLVRPATGLPVASHTASGSVAVHGHPVQVAAASRIWVEGAHDAELVERIWGDDLRVEGVVVEALDGVDHLAAAIASFGAKPGRRLGVLVDHLVPGSKESRIVATIDNRHVLVNGHPFVDVWQAVKPAAVGIPAWPVIGPGQQWKDGVCAALGWGSSWEGWRRVLAGVRTYADLEVPLLRAVEHLIDFVTADR